MSLNVSKIRANILHWLLVTSAIISGILSLGDYLKWIPGRYGKLATTFFALLGGIYLVVIAIEKRLASPAELASVLGGSVSDVTSAEPKIAKELKDFIDATKPFAPKVK